MADQVKLRLEKRKKERETELERRKREKNEQTQPKENPTALLSIFNNEKESLETLIAKLDTLNKQCLSETFEELSKKTTNLQKFLSDSLAFLPSYDVKKLQQEISKLEVDISEKREYYLPKKKFTFSKKKFDKTAKTSVQTHTKAVENEDNEVEREMKYKIEDIIQEEKELVDKDITLSKMKDSKIVLRGTPSALRLEYLEQCQIFCGPVNGSVFVSNCKDCIFVFPCQQLRVHTTVDCKFYLLVTSRAIIEDSKNLGFAEFNWDYPNIAQHFDQSSLDRTKNNWQLVNDFNWLRTDKPSPNWYILRENTNLSE